MCTQYGTWYGILAQARFFGTARHGHPQLGLGSKQGKQNAPGSSAGWAHGSSDVPQRCCSQAYRSACRPEELVTPAAASTCSSGSSAAAPCPVWSDKPLGTSVLCTVPGSPFGFPSLPLHPNPWPLAPEDPCRGSFARSPVRQSAHWHFEALCACIRTHTTPPCSATRCRRGRAVCCCTGPHWTALDSLDSGHCTTLVANNAAHAQRARKWGRLHNSPQLPNPRPPGSQAPRLRLPAFPTHTHLAPPGPAASVSLSFPCLALLLSCRDLRPAAAAEHWQKQTGQALSAPGRISPSAALTTHTTHPPHTHHHSQASRSLFFFAASPPPAHLLGQFTLSLKLPADAHTGWLSDPGPHVLLTSHPIPLISRIPPRPQVLYPPLLYIHIQHHTRRPPSSHPASLSPQSLFRCTPTTTSTFPPLDDPGRTALPCLASPLDVSIIISPTIEPCRQSTTVREPFH